MMKSLMTISLGVVVLGLAGCGRGLSKEEFLSMELQCLHSYCASNAVVAEAALLECARYAEECQKEGIKGIPYDEVLARTYGRLYLVERRLGHSEAAERCLEKYAHFHAVSSSLARRTGRPHGELERLIELKFDHGLQSTWKSP